jgi:hypothetical protein
MSPKFVFGILVPVILVLAAAVFLKEHFRNATPSPVAVATPAPDQNSMPEVAPLPLPASPAPVKAAAKELTLEEKQTAIADEEDRLYTWGMSSDPQSLSNILTDLDAPDKEIRMAAIEAAKQFRNTNVIPVLKAAAVKTDDREEMTALLDAIDFLSLPPGGFSSGGTPLTANQKQEAQQRYAQDEANKQARAQQQQQNQNGQPGPPSQSPPSQ